MEINLTGMVMPTEFNYQVYAVFIGGIALLITSGGLLYKIGRKLGELDALEKLLKSKLESLEEKYNISEKIQKTELNIENKTSKEYVDVNIGKLSDKIRDLNSDVDSVRSTTARQRDFITEVAGVESKISEIDSTLSGFIKSHMEKVELINDKFVELRDSLEKISTRKEVEFNLMATRMGELESRLSTHQERGHVPKTPTID